MELEKREGISPKSAIEFIVLHLLPIGLFWTGATAFDWTLCISLYFIRMFFITGVYHRYFAHKTYKTSRIFQFLLAWGAQTSMQKGALWWAAHHRVHHRTSDTPEDPHSMKLYGFWYSHLGWILSSEYKKTHYNLIQDFAKFKELRWLNNYHLVPPITLAIGLYIWGCFQNSPTGFDYNAGWSTLLCSFFLSTNILYHGTFSINSIMHKFGKARYESGDESKNHLLLALITLGEGWHNNHHYYQATVRQGFFWWEIDITFYVIKIFSWLGLVWDLKGVPDEIKYSKNMEEAKAKMKANLNKAA